MKAYKVYHDHMKHTNCSSELKFIWLTNSRRAVLLTNNEMNLKSDIVHSDKDIISILLESLL